MQSRGRALTVLALLTGVASGAAFLTGSIAWGGAALVLTFALLAVRTAASRYAPFAFTVWVAAFVAASMFFPQAFTAWFGYELRNLIVPLIQIIMFGMGTQLTLQDFRRVFAMPWAVLVGTLLQFTVMPFVGKAMALLFVSRPEVAAGFVLVGSCPGGVASNVMAYLAKANVALSVTMTACSTLAAPVMTPLMTGWLAGTYVEVHFLEMMLSILRMIIVPIVAGLLVNALLRRLGRKSTTSQTVSQFIMRALPLVSMFSICFIIAIITSLSRDDLLAGSFIVPILAAVVIHNVTGYLLGYWGARGLGLGETDARTVAIEVGLQNGGMASGLAIEVLKSKLAAIPPAIFGPWMNMSGAMLASWWAARPPRSAAGTRE